MPGVFGVPVSVPSASRISPVGNEPDVTAKRVGSGAADRGDHLAVGDAIGAGRNGIGLQGERKRLRHDRRRIAKDR